MLGSTVVVGERAGIVIAVDGPNVEVLTFAPGGGAACAATVPESSVRYVAAHGPDVPPAKKGGKADGS